MFDKFRQIFLDFFKKIPRISIDGQFAEMLIIAFLLLLVGTVFLLSNRRLECGGRVLFLCCHAHHRGIWRFGADN